MCLSSALWKNGGSDPDAVWHRRSDGFRGEAGFGNRSTKKGALGAHLGARHCNQWGQPSELRFGVVRAVGRGIAVLDGGPRRAMGREGLGVVLYFQNRKCHCVADGKMFPIRMRKLLNFSVRQTYRWKVRFVGFLAIYPVSRSNLGFMRN